MTQGVLVRVTTVFLPEKTRGVIAAADGAAAVPPKFLFAYRCGRPSHRDVHSN